VIAVESRYIYILNKHDLSLKHIITFKNDNVDDNIRQIIVIKDSILVLSGLSRI
jgi:hypothetical protein